MNDNTKGKYNTIPDEELWAEDPGTWANTEPKARISIQGNTVKTLNPESRLFTELQRDKKRAEQIAKDIDKVLAADIKDTNKLLHKVAVSSEYLTRNFRDHVGSGYFGATKKDYLLTAAEVLEISVSESNGIVEITIPSLLPKRKNKGANFIYDPLYSVLSKYSRDNGKPRRHGKSVLCFTHHYDKERGIKNRIRDYDNLELKDIKDIIALHFLVDDSGYWCSEYHESVLDDKDKTSILIMSPEQFKEWIFSR